MIFAPLDLNRIVQTVQTPNGWIELATIAACFIVAWAVDRWARLGRRGESRVARLGVGSFNRLLFPLAALALLVLARSLVRQWFPTTLFAVAIPLMVALALIRLVVYALRQLFGATDWVAASARAVGFTICGALVLYYIGALSEIATALDEMRLPIGKTQFSLLDLGRDGVIVVLALIIAVWLSSLMEQRLLQMPAGDRNLRVVLAKIFRALCLLIAVLLALSSVGVDLTVLSVFGGALGVGIGLGLQKLASNYIAGFTILIDRSVRLGDMVTIDNRYGIVSKVTARYVVIRSLDGIEAIVPNETLITTTVLNHSYTTRDVKVGVPLQISYDSDLELATRLLIEISEAQPRVLRDALAPIVTINRLAESGIELELSLWINDPENGQGNLKSVVYIAILKSFKEHGIQIPYPQREVRVLAGPEHASAGGSGGQVFLS
jgi:small-conductance mechanosensitive channel